MKTKPGAESISAPVTLSKPGILISQSNGWVAGAERSVEVWSAGDGLILRVDDFQDFHIFPGGRAILPTDDSRELTRQEREVVLGPGLVLALALTGKWCMHCSAALFRGQGIVFLGESGYGKSTLANYLHEETVPGWQRIADDILPVTLGNNGLVGCTHFPQLKLPQEVHSNGALPETIKINNVFTLNPGKGNTPTGCRKLTNPEAMQVLLGQTAGTRLFSAEILAAHLEFCARAVSLVSVYQLSYPHQRELLPAIKGMIEETVK